MVFPTQQPIAIFPDWPRGTRLVDEKGVPSEECRLFLDNLVKALQGNFKNEGILFPRLTGAQIAVIQSIYTPLIGHPLPINIPDISGQTIFDSTNRVPKIFIITFSGSPPHNIVSATWKTFTLT